VRTTRITFLLLVVCASAFSQAVDKRNLKNYEDGGKFDFSWRNGPELNNEMRARLREFIWSAWKTKRPSMVEADFYSVEGDPTTNHIFIEPDKKGNWRVRIWWQMWCCALDALSKPPRKMRRHRGTNVYTIVERWQIDRKTIPSLFGFRYIPPDVPQPPNSYTLHLRADRSDQVGWDL